MKTLIIYFTMGGRTKKIAETIASALHHHKLDLFRIEILVKLAERIKINNQFENKDFSAVESKLNTLDPSGYELFIIGMPTYGNFPPKVFDEIVDRMGTLSGKKAIVFNTARITGEKSLLYMKEKVEKAGAQVIEQRKFKKLFKIGTKSAVEFGKIINGLKG